MFCLILLPSMWDSWPALLPLFANEVLHFLPLLPNFSFATGNCSLICVRSKQESGDFCALVTFASICLPSGGRGEGRELRLRALSPARKENG